MSKTCIYSLLHQFVPDENRQCCWLRLVVGLHAQHEQHHSRRGSTAQYLPHSLHPAAPPLHYLHRTCCRLWLPCETEHGRSDSKAIQQDVIVRSRVEDYQQHDVLAAYKEDCVLIIIDFSFSHLFTWFLSDLEYHTWGTLICPELASEVVVNHKSIILSAYRTD